MKYLITLLPITSTVACIGTAMNGSIGKTIFTAMLTVAYSVLAYIVWVGETQAENAKKGTH